MLPSDRELTIVVNSPVLATILGTRANTNVLLLGGRIRGRTLATVDDWALRPLAELHVDVAFISTNGCSVERELTTPDPAGAAVKRAVIAASRRSVIVTVTLNPALDGPGRPQHLGEETGLAPEVLVQRPARDIGPLEDRIDADVDPHGSR